MKSLSVDVRKAMPKVPISATLFDSSVYGMTSPIDMFAAYRLWLASAVEQLCIVVQVPNRSFVLEPE